MNHQLHKLNQSVTVNELVLQGLEQETLPDEVCHEDQQGLEVEVSLLKGAHEHRGRPATPPHPLLPACHDLITPEPPCHEVQL